MEEQFALETIIRRNLSLLGIKEIISGVSLHKRINKLNIRRYKRNFLFSQKVSVPHIAIINPLVLNHLKKLESNLFSNSENNSYRSVSLIICSGAFELDEFIRKFAEKHNIAVASSTLDEHCLSSRLTGLFRENFQKKTTFHGVVAEIEGRGVLITGASGIGKTTAALQAALDGNYWVADDVVIVRKNAKGELVAMGHQKIRNFIYTQETGIVPVRKLIDFHKIKKSTKITTVIEVEKGAEQQKRVTETKREILGTNVHCLRINVLPGGYFSKDMLKKSLSD